MKETIQKALKASIALRQVILDDSSLVLKITQAAQQMITTAGGGGTIYICGNGGSACDAMHFSEELVAIYERKRPGIRAMHLLDPSTLSCWSNDVDFKTAFARQVETFCTPQDILVLISSSGVSANLLEAAKAAKTKGTYKIGLLGKSGGPLKDLCDLAIVVPSSQTARIQEMHITLIHVFCELLEMQY